MAKVSEKYELMYILKPTLGEEETASLVEKFKALVEANGTLEEIEERGRFENVAEECLRHQKDPNQ